MMFNEIFVNLGTEITHLDLTDNNIKGVPAEIVHLRSLQHLSLCRNGLQCSSETDMTVLPEGMKHLLSLKYLNISECNLSFVPATIWEITSLTHLDISRNNVIIFLSLRSFSCHPLRYSRYLI